MACESNSTKFNEIFQKNVLIQKSQRYLYYLLMKNETNREISSIAMAYAKVSKPAPPYSVGISTANKPNSPNFLTWKI